MVSLWLEKPDCIKKGIGFCDVGLNFKQHLNSEMHSTQMVVASGQMSKRMVEFASMVGAGRAMLDGHPSSASGSFPSSSGSLMDQDF